uniref:RNase H type-1 domain-containing protein n=1 Tax=Fagus sylvatica TaxID=28930 RepID=A0A2N9JAB7_FAGSY
MKKVQPNAIYFGNPLFSSKSRSKDFCFLHDKLESRLVGWRSKVLSWAGHATMIKVVASALPCYTFSTSDVPISVCDKLDSTTHHFWWNPKKEFGRYLAWKAWDELCKPKVSGGLGFRKAKKFNEALIAKFTWMVASGFNSPCILALQSVCAILKISIPLSPIEDKLVWVADSKGLFSVKSTLKLSMVHLESPIIDPCWSSLWKCKIHERLKMFLWRIGSETLPTNAALVARMGKGPGPLVSFVSDTVHVGNGLDIIKFVLNPPVCPGSPTKLCGISPDSSTQFALILDCIWSFRNQIVHQGPLQSPLTCLKSLKLRIMEHSTSLDPGDFMCPREVSWWLPPPPQIVAFDSSSAEAAAIVWALEIASSLKFPRIIVESDAKLCVDVVLGKPLDSCWRREANSVAHELASFFPPHGLPFSYKMDSLPPSFKEAWLSEFPAWFVAL